MCFLSCLCVVYVLSICCLYGFSTFLCHVYVLFMFIFFLCVVYVLSMSCLCLVYVNFLKYIYIMFCVAYSKNVTPTPFWVTGVVGRGYFQEFPPPHVISYDHTYIVFCVATSKNSPNLAIYEIWRKTLTIRDRRTDRQSELPLNGALR